MMRPCRHILKGALGLALSVLLAFTLAFWQVPAGAFWGAQLAYAEGEEDVIDDGSEIDEAVQQEAEDLAAAQAVDDLIAALPDASSVQVSDKAFIDEVQAAYEALTDSQKAYVTGLDRLNEAIAAVQAKIAEEEAAAQQEADDMAAAQVVSDMISALPDATSATGADVPAATAAQEAYNALTDAQKARVQGADKLAAVVAAATAAKEAEDASGEGEGGEGEGGETETQYVKTLLLKWDKPDDEGVTHFVGDNRIVERAYKQISINEYGETVQLNGWYLSTDGSGVAYQTADGSTSIGSFPLKWTSSDEGIATVSPDGLVTPRGVNGSVVITALVDDANVYQGDAPEASVTINFDGQEGKYVEKVEILDENGTPIGESWGGTTVYDEQNAFHQLQAQVTWRHVADGSTTIETTGAGEDYDASQVGTTITWNVSQSTAFTINADTGRLRTGSYSGNAYVTCTAVGGLGGKDVTDSANVQLDTGVYEYNPADSLTLKVVWEERPDEVVKEATFSVDELLSRLPTRTQNATVVNESRFGVIRAEGFLFKDVVDLVAVDDADVLQYRFSTADGYDNPVSYKYLFESGNRYYFPNYDIGKSRAGGEIVPPLLAYKSSFEWGRAEANPDAPLDEGTRFRLVFGCLASGDANTSYQIYYINGITIVLKGAPAASTGKDSKSGGSTSGGKKSGGQEQTGGSSAASQPEKSSGTGASSSSGSSGKSGKGSKGKKRSSSNAGGSSSSGQKTGGTSAADDAASENATSGESASTQDADDASQQGDETDASEGAADGDGDFTDAAKRWRVYQMMNKNNSDVPDWDDENPISPFAAPVALGTFAVGAGATGISFRRRLK